MVHGTSTAVASPLRQKAIASAGATVAAISGPEVETAKMPTTIVTRSAGAGTASTSGASIAVTRRVSPMDADAPEPRTRDIPTLLGGATKKSGLIWVRPAGRGHHAQGVWHVWQDGAAWVLCGGIEQPLPDLGRRAAGTARSKAKGSRLLTWVADAARVEPGSDEWQSIVPTLQAKRLNSPHGHDAPPRGAPA